ncbi:glycosyltransferase family 2 protein [Treponema primitia]|uniref:glycosyltransferase family 2 protein n=1 Tax=Treponema primitia TaxID=88058 RepID=UPI0002555605|nr:glycosyltransferase family 2 protein [Treponema primitia]
MFKISIITVTLNSELTLENTILSVINQKDVNIEYIIIDGNSSDDTLKIIEKYRDSIALIISERDDGIYDAMNKGIKYATGEFLLFLGSDDILANVNVISNVSKSIDDLNAVYYGDSYFFKRNILHSGIFCELKLFNINICHQSIFYPKSIYKKNIYNIKYKYLADYDYNLKIYKTTRFYYINMLITLFNDEGSCDKNIDKFFLKDKTKIILNIYGFNKTIIYIITRPIYLIIKKILTKIIKYL